ncbi:hypothetical protein Taro_023308 [Colocasia esculenta]|uniref:Uncharacterized protein n=1 Tax=Colocasia esculenta TaxID=4460 RepID=A0A843V7Y7_COLES|nr:hypothetical protein [Colocasia esculenta]
MMWTLEPRQDTASAAQAICWPWLSKTNGSGAKPLPLEDLVAERLRDASTVARSFSEQLLDVGDDTRKASCERTKQSLSKRNGFPTSSLMQKIMNCNVPLKTLRMGCTTVVWPDYGPTLDLSRWFRGHKERDSEKKD